MKYAAEQILHILLDPEIPVSKICTRRPTNVVKSATYVIDISKLAHPNVVKNNNFGTWKYSGSHQAFKIKWRQATSHWRSVVLV